MSFQISIPPDRAEAAFFVSDVRRSLQKALVEAKPRGITQASIARVIGVNRSVINRELKGTRDLSLGRVAQFAWAMGLVPILEFMQPASGAGANAVEPPPAQMRASTTDDSASLIDKVDKGVIISQRAA